MNSAEIFDSSLVLNKIINIYISHSIIKKKKIISFFQRIIYIFFGIYHIENDLLDYLDEVQYKSYLELI